ARTRRGRRKASLGLAQRQLGDGNARFDRAQTVRQRSRLMGAEGNRAHAIPSEHLARSALSPVRRMQRAAAADVGVVEVRAARSARRPRTLMQPIMKRKLLARDIYKEVTDSICAEFSIDGFIPWRLRAFARLAVRRDLHPELSRTPSRTTSGRSSPAS